MTEKEKARLYKAAVKLSVELNKVAALAVKLKAEHTMYTRCVQGANTWINMMIDYAEPKKTTDEKSAPTAALPVSPGGNE